MAEAPYSILTRALLMIFTVKFRRSILKTRALGSSDTAVGKIQPTALQLIWYALAELPSEQREYPVYVISSDTLVETPVIVNYITKTLERIETAAREQEMPFQTDIVRPKINRYLLDQSHW